MSTYSKPLSYTILLSSLLLLTVSPITIGLAGHAFYILALNFQPGTYTWLPDTTHSDVYPGERRFVQLVYDWSTENLIFASAGLGLFAGTFGVLARMMHGQKNQKFGNIASSKVYITAITMAFLSLIGCLICNGWAAVVHNRLSKTCRDTPENNAFFTCSRELAACRILPNISWADTEVPHIACTETTASRMLMIIVVLVSAVLAVSLGVQMRFARKEGSARSRTEYKTVETERA
ncbi:hypothetical protein NX059_011293 [Plenodomus lindquistii]|nr:hypothetical protein NX059_011293 [Plenodomus lindquistii]